MADSDLEAIRRARLQQLQSESAQGGGGQGSKEEDQRSREADARASIISQILEPDAADRLNRIRMVNPNHAGDVESRLIMLAQNRQLQSRVSEAQLKDLLGALSEQQQKKEEVTVLRRKGILDDDDDLDDLLKDV